MNIIEAQQRIIQAIIPILLEGLTESQTRVYSKLLQGTTAALDNQQSTEVKFFLGGIELEEDALIGLITTFLSSFKVSFASNAAMMEPMIEHFETIVGVEAAAAIRADLVSASDRMMANANNLTVDGLKSMLLRRGLRLVN